MCIRDSVWALRKAGLGILGNMKGDARPVSLIEDTAVRVNDLESYINDLSHLLASYGKDSVYHAHIGTGELHIRPVLNLKDPDDVALFRTIGLETARLVKKYREMCIRDRLTTLCPTALISLTSFITPCLVSVKTLITWFIPVV